MEERTDNPQPKWSAEILLNRTLAKAYGLPLDAPESALKGLSITRSMVVEIIHQASELHIEQMREIDQLRAQLHHATEEIAAARREVGELRERIAQMQANGGIADEAPEELFLVADSGYGCDAWLNVYRVGVDINGPVGGWKEVIDEGRATMPVRYVKATKPRLCPHTQAGLEQEGGGA